MTDTQFCPSCSLPYSAKNFQIVCCSFGCFVATLRHSPLRFWAIVVLPLLLSLLYGLPTFTDLNLTPSGLVPFYLPVSATLVLLFAGIPLAVFSFRSILNKLIYPAEAALLATFVGDFVWGFSLPVDTPHRFLTMHLLPPLLLITCGTEAFFSIRWGQPLVSLRMRIPVKARLLVKNQETEIETSTLKEGDLVRVLPGEIIPCDGIITQGATSVDESRLTGEKTILLKQKNERVTGGSLNRDEALVIRIDQEPSAHIARRIARDVALSPGRESGSERHARLLFLAVGLLFLSSALLLAVTGRVGSALALVTLAGFLGWIRLIAKIKASARGLMALSGILVKTTDSLEKTGRIKNLFFDKTGILTQGKFDFSQLYLEYGSNQGTVLSTIFSLETASNHPIAAGVKSHPWYSEVEKHSVKNVEIHPGLGICGTLLEKGKKERFAAVGNLRFLKRFQMQVSRGMRETVEQMEAVGETVVLCGWEGQVRGLMSLADALRPDTKPLFDALGHLSVKPVMITADHDQMISQLSYAHGLKEAYTRCLPDEKIKKIRNRQEKGELCGMVVCRTDDDEVALKADVALAIGLGTQSPPRQCPILILGEALSNISRIVRYSRSLTRLSAATLVTGIAATLFLGLGTVLIEDVSFWPVALGAGLVLPIFAFADPLSRGSRIGFKRG